MHSNSVKVLSAALAPSSHVQKRTGADFGTQHGYDFYGRCPVALRRLVGTRIWRQQHAADFLTSGRILLYDNLGAGDVSCLEIDPCTQAAPWSYSCEFMNTARGMAKPAERQHAHC